MPLLKQKVVAYITHEDRLLVFRHPAAPEAGIQVPAGTLHAGEPPAVGVMREALEETGLPALTLVRLLGEYVWDLAPLGLAERHQRWVYHLRYEGEPPVTWRHAETDPSDGSVKPIVFEFAWVRVPQEVPLLSGDQGRWLPQLLESLSAPA
ncbi:MAG: NUDIX domain-containing protein [Candidatus Latescibacteria bacterium]|nr:NUDIX domain-containing protein [Candidatus Latescibacterota bacterium]